MSGYDNNKTPAKPSDIVCEYVPVSCVKKLLCSVASSTVIILLPYFFPCIAREALSASSLLKYLTKANLLGIARCKLVGR